MFSLENQTIHDLFSLITALIFGTLGLVLGGIALPKEDIWQKVRMVRRYLSGACFTLCLSGLGVVAFSFSYSAQPMFMVRTLFIAALQILFFTCILLVIIESPTLKLRWVVLQFVITFLIGGILLTLSSQDQVNRYGVYTMALTAYVLQNFYYIYTYRHDLLIYVADREGSLDRRQKIHLRWGRSSFYYLLTAAACMIFASFFGGLFYIVCITICIFLYLHLTIRFYNDLFWGSLNYHINDFTVAEVDPQSVVESQGLVRQDDSMSAVVEGEIPAEDQIFHERLQKWIAVKGYLDKNLSVDDMAEVLNVDRNYLRYYFRTYVKNEFRTWRSELRIRESLSLMKQHPEYTLSKVAEMVGYNHRSNFFKQFENITGISPSVYKESCEKKRTGK